MTTAFKAIGRFAEQVLWFVLDSFLEPPYYLPEEYDQPNPYWYWL